MLVLIIICFVLTLLVGLYLISFVLQDRNTPKTIAAIHGPLALIGLILLIVYSVSHRVYPLSSLIFFIIAACGGLFLIYRDLKRKSIPKIAALGHGLIAAVALILLLGFAVTFR